MRSVEEQWVVRASDQRTLDERAYAAGVAQDALMESAGTNAAQWILDRMHPRRVVVVSGPGGNGGDGLVVARRLHEAGIEVQAALLQDPMGCSPAVQRMIERMEKAGVPAPRPVSDRMFEAWLDRADCLVDSLFGSGLRRPLRGEALRVVGRINAAQVCTISLDLPSGLASDTGERVGEAVQADITLAMAFLKPAHLLCPAAMHCGNTAVVDVAYPEATVESVEPWARVCESAGIASRLPVRRLDGHKGTFGRVLVLAGSLGMTGAAVLCCRGALRAGAGLVSVATPASVASIVATAVPEAITIPMLETEGRLAGIDDPQFERAMERADVLVMGPGLSREADTLEAVRALIERFNGPIVLDADAHGAVHRNEDVLERLAGRTILTPHPGEFGALTGEAPDAVDRLRRDQARAFAMKHNVVLVLKGHPTAIGLPEGTVYLNPTGNDGLATGGSGDVLAGLIAGLVAGGSSLPNAAVVAVYVHGLAAEIYGRDRSPRALIPSELIDQIPEALWEVTECS